MKIKDGYNSEPMEISVVLPSSGAKVLEFWIKNNKIGESNKDEIISYITLDEALELKREIEEAIIKLIKS